MSALNFQKSSSITKPIFSHSRSEQFLKQNTNSQLSPQSLVEFANPVYLWLNGHSKRWLRGVKMSEELET